MLKPDIFNMKYNNIFPLREIKFERFPVYVQKNYKAFLKKVYGAEVPPELPLKKCYPHEGRIGKTQAWQKKKYNWLYTKRRSHKFKMMKGSWQTSNMSGGGAFSGSGTLGGTFSGSGTLGGTFSGSGTLGVDPSREKYQDKIVKIIQKLLFVAVAVVNKKLMSKISKRYRLQYYPSKRQKIESRSFFG